MGGNGDRHSLLGKWAPNVILHTHRSATQLADLMSSNKGLLVDLTEGSVLPDIAAKWGNRFQLVSARCYERPPNLEAMLVRPDGYIAWILRPGAEGNEAKKTLCGALQEWFGARLKERMIRELCSLGYRVELLDSQQANPQ